ncbi:LPS translocon maturation chaperone LptM [Salinarimonas rosea]|uniref:LPS translocon maturation chaperone LptM n=1 Tax=Salinarimonas rosea TaxID=552063 RepID=UPI0003F9C59A|nr:lipoprotein [Salinarimonas rosea]
MRASRASVGVILGVAAVLALSACGRRGSLEPPPGAGPAPLADEARVPSDPLTEVPVGGPREPESVPVTQPDRPFPLDFLL